jgi:hypothetical protein
MPLMPLTDSHSRTDDTRFLFPHAWTASGWKWQCASVVIVLQGCGTVLEVIG